MTDVHSTIDWLVDGARSAATPEGVLAEMCARLVAAGLPLWRVNVFVRTLHPELMGRRLRCRAIAFDVVAMAQKDFLHAEPRRTRSFEGLVGAIPGFNPGIAPTRIFATSAAPREHNRPPGKDDPSGGCQSPYAIALPALGRGRRSRPSASPGRGDDAARRRGQAAVDLADPSPSVGAAATAGAGLMCEGAGRASGSGNTRTRWKRTAHQSPTERLRMASLLRSTAASSVCPA